MKSRWFVAFIAASLILCGMAACEKGGSSNTVTEQPAPPPANAPQQAPPVYAPVGGPTVYAPPPVVYPAPVYTYYYYPDAEVYFEPATQIYFWFDGGGWHRDHVLPPTVVLQRQSPVTVQLNTAVPWTMHDHVRSAHPGHIVIGHARD
jgi:hypothetical protein